jgi:hypothetical protein
MEEWYTPSRIWISALLGLCYAIPAGAAYLNWDRLRNSGARQQNSRRLWLAITAILACVTIAVWSQLPHMLETFCRDMLVQTGHWENRRPLQAVVIGLLALATAVVVGFVLMRSEVDWAVRLLFFGAIAVASEILIDSVSLHYVDAILAYRIASLISLSGAIKVIGIVWIWFWTAVASQELFSGKTQARPRHRR